MYWVEQLLHITCYIHVNINIFLHSLEIKLTKKIQQDATVYQNFISYL